MPSGSYCAFETAQVLELPGASGTAGGATNIRTLAGRLCGAYAMEPGSGHLRPAFDLDAVHVGTSEYGQHGVGIYDLERERRAAFIATPPVAFGPRRAFSGGWMLHA